MRSIRNLGVLALLALPAGTAAAQAERKLPRTEVLILADLSDRIDQKLHPTQIGRDTAIVDIVANEFGGIVKRNRYLFSRDRLRMMYLGGENEPTEPRIDVAEMNTTHRIVVKELPQELSVFQRQAVGPYLKRRTKYEGADLWSWFHNAAPQVLKVDDPSRETETRIVILTDGYLEFAPSIHRAPGTYMNIAALRGRKNWEQIFPRYRLTPVGFRFPNTKVLIIELAPLRPQVNTTEQDILERYWTDWFKEMGIDAQFVTNSEALPTVRDAIQQFLSH